MVVAAVVAILVGLALFLIPALERGLSLSQTNGYQTGGAAFVFVGLLLLALAAGAFRAWRSATAGAAFRGWTNDSGRNYGVLECPNCGTPNSEVARRCVACGTNLPSVE